MTVEAMAEDLGIKPEEILEILKANNIQASAGQTLKDIASEYDMHPSELVKMVQGN